MGLKKTALPGWVVSFCYCSRVGTFETESAVKKTWQQEFAVFKCEATANFVTGHVCVNSNVVSRAFGVRTNLYLRIVPVNGTIIGGILNR